MNRSVPLTVLSIAALAPPVATPWIGMASAATTARSRLVTGPSVNMRWGPVQVKIRVRGKKILNVSAAAPIERPRSRTINSQALPILRQEVLQAQSARIFVVSGATLTSDAYAGSLQAAIKKAHV